ncbi:MAG: DnaJ domain [Candidatus Hydrogenedentota bacterium]|jgi:curved DNA-binding protein CbpA
MVAEGYINYFSVLEISPDANPGEVRKSYKRLMKELVVEISQAQLTEEGRNQYLLKMAQLNAAFYILRDEARRVKYVEDRDRAMALEAEWSAEVAAKSDKAEPLRRQYDAALKHYLSAYMEELMLEAGRDSECVEASHWDANHERHASRVLRQYRQRLYHQIHERLPFYDITRPEIDWDERGRAVASMLAERN